jgi:hypothetical protein
VQIGDSNFRARFRKWPNYEAMTPDFETLFFKVIFPAASACAILVSSVQ